MHLPSQTLPAAAAVAAARDVPLSLLESAQLGRLCDVADPLVDVVFVAPAPVDAAVEDFWMKVRTVGCACRVAGVVIATGFH